MSKTLRVRIETTARIVISSEAVAVIESERAKCLDLKEKYPEQYAKLSGSRSGPYDCLIGDDFTIEGFVKLSIRGGIREFTKDELCREFTQEGLRFDRAQAKVTFE